MTSLSFSINKKQQCSQPQPQPRARHLSTALKAQPVLTRGRTTARSDRIQSLIGIGGNNSRSARVLTRAGKMSFYMASEYNQTDNTGNAQQLGLAGEDETGM